MASPLIGVAGVNSLLFASYGVSKRIISPFGPHLSLPQIALAGSMAGAANAILASPVEMFKVRMQGQYGSSSDQRLRVIVSEMWRTYGLRKGIMRGYWVRLVSAPPRVTLALTSLIGDHSSGDTSLRGILYSLRILETEIRSSLWR